MPKLHWVGNFWNEGQSSIYFSYSDNLYDETLRPHHKNLTLKIPPRVVAFGWLAVRGSILTMDNLRKRRILVVNACPMCLRAEETVDHLFLIAPWQRRSGGLSLIFLIAVGSSPSPYKVIIWHGIWAGGQETES